MVDTNILLEDPKALLAFPKSKIIIPIDVLQEIDNHKRDFGDTGANARATSRLLDELSIGGNLKKGVKHNDTHISVVHWDSVLNAKLNECELDNTIDNRIICTALMHKATVISNDILVRIKSRALGLKAIEYSKSSNGIADIYSGIVEYSVNSDLIDQFYADGHIDMDVDLCPNQYALLQSIEKEGHTAVVRWDGERFSKVDKHLISGFRARNLEQTCALDLLMDDEVSLVSLMGSAGSGKTILALASALDLVLHKGEYDKIVIVRHPYPVGRDIGFLPGSLDEKMAAWSGSIIDNCDLLEQQFKFSFESLLASGKLSILPPATLRGRSFLNSFIIIDEAQSLNVHEIKTIITRVGDTSKIVLTGDVNQIDNFKLDFETNGLTHVINAFKNYDIAGHITLNKCERGSLAGLAAAIL